MRIFGLLCVAGALLAGCTTPNESQPSAASATIEGSPAAGTPADAEAQQPATAEAGPATTQPADCRAADDFAQTSTCLRQLVLQDERLDVNDRALTLAYLDAVAGRVRAGQLTDAQADAALTAFETRMGRPIAAAAPPPAPSFADDPLAATGAALEDILPDAGAMMETEALRAGETLTIPIEGGAIVCERRAYATVTCS
jgi:hypothetical protein